MNYTIPIKNFVQETDDCISIEFDISEELKKEFDYLPGQYLTLCAVIDGKEERRSYSLCSSPFEKKWSVAIKKVSGGLFSTWIHNHINDLKYIDLLLPQGKFFKGNIAENSNYLFLTAGSGITPIISIIKHVLNSTLNSQITLIYGNKRKESIIFLEALEAIKNKYLNRVQFFQVLSQQQQDIDLFNGRINSNKLLQFNKIIDVNNYNAYFICGPETMIDDCNIFFTENKISKEKIFFERFGVLQKNKERKPIKIESEEEHASIEIKIDGRNYKFNLDFNTENILDAATKQGADMPYACKGGVCCTCKAKLIEGKVQMTVCYGLEQDEIDAGYILTCQSYPLTKDVKIDFDH